MTVSLFHRFQVKDFATWLNPDPGVPAKLMADNGVLAYSLHRNLDDPNTLMLYYQFPDMTTLKAYVALVEGFPGEMKNFYAVPGTVEWWVGEDVPGYSIKP